MNISHYINLAIPFLQAGLIEGTVNPVTKAPDVSSWKAEPWMAGGMAAIMLHDPNDHATEQQVQEMLTKLAGGPGEWDRGGSGSRGNQQARRLPGCGISGGIQARILLRRGAGWKPGYADSGHARLTRIFAGVSRDARIVFCFGGGDRAPSRPWLGGYAPDCADRGADFARADADGEGCATAGAALECRARARRFCS